MADEKLVKALRAGLASGLTEQQVKERLVGEGWSVTDVNGAYAIHVLSLKPIGSNLINTWKQSDMHKKESAITHLFRTIGFLGLLLIAGVVIDWYGYTLPFMKQYAVRMYIEQKLGAPATVEGATATSTGVK